MSQSTQPLFNLICDFKLSPLIEIKFCAHRVIAGRQLVALVTTTGDVMLYYTNTKNTLPVVKQVPWFVEEGKAISAMCFDPWGTWLLIASEEGSVHIIPVFPLVDPAIVVGHKWSTTDVTSFAPSTPKQKPTGLVWWQTYANDQYCVMGGEHGEVTFLDLTNGAELGTMQVPVGIRSLHLCPDNQQDGVHLLITGTNREQWRLLLEQQSKQYVRPFRHTCVKVGCNEEVGGGGPDLVADHRSNGSTVRTRLQGLKQLSAEKIASLRQRLAETRKGGRTRIPDIKVDDERYSGDDGPRACPLCPERLIAYVGETQIHPQFARSQHVFSGYYIPSSILTVHNMELDVVPLFIHKLPPDCEDILLTDHLIYATNTERRKLSVISAHLSESKLEGNGSGSECNPEAIIQEFPMPPDERIITLFKKTTPCSPNQGQQQGQQGSGDKIQNKRNLVAVVAVPVEEKKEGVGGEGQPPMEAIKKMALEMQGEKGPVMGQKSDKKVEVVVSQECVLVTNKGIYEVKLRKPPSDVYLELVLQQKLEQADKLGSMLGLNTQHLLEVAADKKLAEKDFTQAISLYRMSRCSHLKSVLKFASAGHVAELLTYIHVLFTSSGIDLSPSDKVHISNLGILCYIEQVLRASSPRAGLFKQFLKFLEENPHYDENLAVKMLSQMWCWEAVHFVGIQRGMFVEVLDALLRAIHATDDQKEDGLLHGSWKNADAGLVLCFTEPGILQGLMLNPEAARFHLQLVQTHLLELDGPSLVRLATLYDPSHPSLRPGFTRLFVAARFRQKSVSSLASVDSEILDFVEDEDEGLPLEEMVETFLMVLLALARHRGRGQGYDPALLEPLYRARRVGDGALTPTRPQHPTLMAAGYAHSGLVRNNGLHTWGTTTSGCLGHGPQAARVAPPRPVRVFPTLRLRVASVSCGKHHTLALTGSGVYAWGSNQYGQLGQGGVGGRRPYPSLVEALVGRRVSSVECGQFHSAVVTAEGQLLTWGWGVHGQLGHGRAENLGSPRLVRAFAGKVVSQVKGGYGHSVMVDGEGRVYSCGCGLFGQLGGGGTMKRTQPEVVQLPEKITMIATGYFHTMVVGASNNMYTWGSSPQNLRLLAQGQRKKRMQQQQQQNQHPTEGAEEESPPLPASPTSAEPEPVADEPPAPIPHPEAHLTPSEVDTSLVEGDIVQVSCGGHHSALLTGEGTVYTWGRNLDGQLGNGSRKEVVAPQPVASLLDVYVAHVACGYDFTLAAEAGGGVWGWGSNAGAQLGRAPAEDARGGDGGKVFMLKTTKRIIRLHHGVQNAVELPTEVKGIPAVLTTAPDVILEPTESSQKKILRQLICELPVLRPLDEPEFGLATLHIAMEYFFDGYTASKIMAKCLEMENYQAAAKLSTLEGHYPQAFLYQLQALSRGKGRSKCASSRGAVGRCSPLTPTPPFSSALASPIGLQDDECVLEMAAANVEKSEGSPSSDGLATEAARVVDYYSSLLDEESHMKAGRVLEAALEFWASHGLPIEFLEESLKKHMGKFMVPLGLLLSRRAVGGAGVESQGGTIMGQLSPGFCLQLCSAIEAQSDHKMMHPELLGKLNSALEKCKISRCSQKLGLDVELDGHTNAESCDDNDSGYPDL